MKRNQFLLLAALACFMSFSGCKVKDLIKATVGIGSMSAKINGNQFTATSCVATRTPAGGGAPAGYSLGGNGTSAYPAITLTLYTTVTGANTLGVAGVGNPFAIYAESSNAQGNSVSGTITISSISYSMGGTVKGTFSFTGNPGNYVVTEGSFESKFVN